MPMDTALHTLTARIEAARTHATPLAIRGGGSKAFYASQPDGEVLDARTLAGVLSYEPSELVVTVGAGTPLAELEALLAAQGQCLPFEPPHFAWSGNGAAATVGGMVATGLAGPARASVGGVRDYVLGAKIINGLGQQLSFGGQVMKNVAGYDVSRLMVGSLGTLGLITEVSLKVLPVAPAEATLCFELAQAQALDWLHRWGAQPLPLNASCWVRDDSASGQPARDLLFVRLRGAVAAVEAACRALCQDVPGTRMDNAVAGPDWARCRNQQLPFFRQAPPGAVLWRLSLPQTAPVLGLAWPQLVEWHGAVRWLWAPPDARATLQQAAQAVGGQASLFYAPPDLQLAAEPRLQVQDATLATLNARLKASFDPQGLFNPALSPVPANRAA